MIKPVGHRVLIKPDVVEETHDLGNGKRFILDTKETKREQAATTTGVVVDIGPTAWEGFDRGSSNWVPWAKVGDRVIYAKYAGKEVTKEGDDKLICINDEDIIAVETEED